MTNTAKIFCFFAVCAIVKIATATPEAVQEPIKKYDRAEQCAEPGATKYLVILSYDGRPIEKAYFRCDNGMLISSSKM